MSKRTPRGFGLSHWKRAYESGDLDLVELVDWVGEFDEGDPAWIRVATPAEVSVQLQRLPERRARAGVRRLPLDGIPFAIKDNIDSADWPTTAGCPAFSRVAKNDAVVVEQLRLAGAILVGKTNLDQFATGLVGTRSPYGVVPSSFDRERIGGGSSSGSAAVVARGWVPFSLGTDTAGSGRVPAAFHNIVGYKPTRGRFSTRGLVPACRTLDCPSIFALSVDDAVEVAKALDRYDPSDPFARKANTAIPPLEQPRIAMPDVLEFFGDRLAEAAFMRALSSFEALGLALGTVDFRPFRELAELLYSATWVAERSLVAGELLDAGPEVMDSTVRGILLHGRTRTAEQAFLAEYRRAELARHIDEAFDHVDVLVVPTTPTTYRIDEVLESPISTNSRLGIYTNFTNLADLSAIALPGPFRDDEFPAGITLLARAHHEPWLVTLARRLESVLDVPLGATGRRRERVAPAFSAEESTTDSAADHLALAVVGAHLSGMALNHQLTSREAVLHGVRRTAPRYELCVLAGTGPRRPGLFRSGESAGPGRAIEVEVWSMPRSAFGSFLELIPAPLGLGKIELDDGTWVSGFICEPWGRPGSTDITHFGGFRAFLAAEAEHRTGALADRA